jgi:hypothetical protein
LVSADGSVTCQAAGAGTVTSVASGFGLTGGPVTGSGSLAADPAVLQQRVNGTCTGLQALQSIAQDGTATCLPPPGGSLIPQAEISDTPSVIQVDGVNIAFSCDEIAVELPEGVVIASDSRGANTSATGDGDIFPPIVVSNGPTLPVTGDFYILVDPPNYLKFSYAMAEDGGSCTGVLTGISSSAD